MMKTTKTNKKRPAKRAGSGPGRPVKSKPAPKPRSVAEPLRQAEDDKIAQAIRQTQDVDLPQAGLKVNAEPSDLTPPDLSDLKATMPKKNIGPKKDAAIRPEWMEKDQIQQLMRMVNSRLRTTGSVWAADDTELEFLSESASGMIDKYFPEGKELSIEVSFVLAVALYAGPRVLQLYQQKKAANVATQPTAPAPVAAEPVKDSRFENL